MYAEWNSIGNGFRCSNCGAISEGKTDFCPNCGARMYSQENALASREIIRMMMAEQGMTQSVLAKKMETSQAHIAGFLNRKKTELRSDIFSKMVHAMGGEVVVRTKDGKELVME